MKVFSKLIGIIVITTGFVFAMTSCDDSIEENGGEVNPLVARWYGTQEFADAGGNNWVLEFKNDGTVTSASTGGSEPATYTVSGTRITFFVTQQGITTEMGAADYEITGTRLTFSNISGPFMIGITGGGMATTFYKSGSGGSGNGGGTDNGNNDSIPSALVGKWHSKASTSQLAFEITSAGKLLAADTSYDISVSGNTVELKFGGTPVGTFTYALSDNEMLVLNGTGVGMTIVPFSPVLKLLTVTYNIDGAAVSTQTVVGSSRVSVPSTAGRPGYEFDGWYKESTFETKWNFSTDTVTADVTLYARWINGTIRITGFDIEHENFYVVGFGFIESMSNSTLFAGVDIIGIPGRIQNGEVTLNVWRGTFGSGPMDAYLENDKNVPFEFYIYDSLQQLILGEEPYEYGYATANFTGGNATVAINYPTPFAVTFNIDGEAVSIQTFLEGSRVLVPNIADRPGYSFDGWYKESTFETKWNFPTDTVTADITLYARWIPTFTVTFNIDGTTVFTETVIMGGKVLGNFPMEDRPGYYFDSWYKESTFETKWNFSTDTVTADVTLYARWIPPPMAEIT